MQLFFFAMVQRFHSGIKEWHHYKTSLFGDCEVRLLSFFGCWFFFSSDRLLMYIAVIKAWWRIEKYIASNINSILG